MPWDTTRPSGQGTQSKYTSPEHRRRRAALVAELKQVGCLTCTAKHCLFDTRAITNPNGRDRDGLHLGHQDNGIDYAGPQHNLCNTRDGAQRGNQRSHGISDEPHRWVL